MKKLIIPFLLLTVMFSLVLVSCDKDNVEPVPTPTKTDTNYVTIDGITYKLLSSIDNNGTLYFSGTTNTTTVTYPYIAFDFGSNSLPTSTTTMNGTLQIYKGASGVDIYENTRDFQVVVNNGEHSITFSNISLSPLTGGGADITCSGNLTVKQ